MSTLKLLKYRRNLFALLNVLIIIQFNIIFEKAINKLQIKTSLG